MVTNDSIHTEGCSEESIRSWLYVTADHFHICNGHRPGGCFLQSEAWPVHTMVMDHIVRIAEREAES